jgi:hypothetical protein
MPELSSCYFCRATLDALVERSTLAASGGDETTVALCPPCRRKLVAVLERTVAADPAAETDTLLGAASDPDATGEDPRNEPGVADVTPNQGSPVLSETESEDGRSEAADGQDGTKASRPRKAVGGDETPIFDGADDAADAGADTAAVFGSGSETETESADAASEAEVVREAEPDADGSNAEGESADTPSSEESGDDGGEAAAQRVDTDTYNRVVRLLQNREFPVPTADIREVAVSAYDIDPADFRVAIDAAVDRGVLVEDGDRLDVPN